MRITSHKPLPAPPQLTTVNHTMISMYKHEHHARVLLCLECMYPS
jgi:hypothetical protein